MRKILNIALVGYGAIAKTHMLGIAIANIKMKLPFELRVSHIVIWGNEEVPYETIKVCHSLDEVLQDHEDVVDIVDVVNINEAHFDAIQRAVEMGKPIYCEKPLTQSLANSKKALDIVTMNSIINGVPLIFRYLPCVHLLKQQIEAKSLGNIIDFHGRLFHASYLNSERRNTWRAKTDAGGGAIIDLGIHLVDLIRFIFGEIAFMETDTRIHFQGVKNDEITRSKVQTASGYQGELLTSRIYKQHKQADEIIVYCEKGSYTCDLTKPYELEINEVGKGTTFLKISDEKISSYVLSERDALQYHQDAHTAAIADMARKVYDGSQSGFGAEFEDAYRAQELLENRKNGDTI